VTVLIVDDSPVMRNFVRRVMRLAGFDEAEYLEASDGGDGLRRVQSTHVDLVLTDINMPNMNGEEFLAAMHADEALRGIPAVVISTDATHHRKARLTALGARGYIAKPFSPEALREEIDRAMGVPL
jgi:two-component system, chemotaxis family, chemotaxis protein CheY